MLEEVTSKAIFNIHLAVQRKKKQSAPISLWTCLTSWKCLYILEFNVNEACETCSMYPWGCIFYSYVMKIVLSMLSRARWWFWWHGLFLPQAYVVFHLVWIQNYFCRIMTTRLCKFCLALGTCRIEIHQLWHGKSHRPYKNCQKFKFGVSMHKLW